MADEKIFEYHPANVVPLYFEEGEPPVAIDVLYNILTSSKDYGTKYTLETIPLHLATDQFIAYMAALKAFDMDIASDFIQIGTTLLKIKSEALLRVPIEEEPEEEDLFAEDILRRRLLVYKIVKDNEARLKEREKLYRINRRPKYTDADAIIVIDKFDMAALLDAFGVVLYRIDEKDVALQIKKIPRDKYPVSKQVRLLAKVMSEKKKIGFYSLFTNEVSKSEVISTFQSMLVLMKNQVVFAEQEGNGEIQLEFNPEYEGKEIDFDAMGIEEDEDEKEDEASGKLG